MNRCPLKPLHGELNRVKLEQLDKLSSDRLKATLAPGEPACLKAKADGTIADGTIMDGHHRVAILRARGEDVDALPREIVP